MNISKFIREIPEEERTPLVIQLLEIIQFQTEQIQQLKDEIARLKGQKPKPDIKPSRLEKPRKKGSASDSKKSGKRPGSDKRSKTKSLEINDDKVVQPDFIPEGSRFKGYQDYVVQDLLFQPHNIRFRLACWEGPDRSRYVGKVPEEFRGKHFGPHLISFILFQHYHAMTTQPLILEQLLEIGIDISAGQINRILIENKDEFHQEKEEILKVGLEVSRYINVDDTGARHDGKNGYCTHIGNEHFAYFESSESKNRINFLRALQADRRNYVINTDAVGYLVSGKLPAKELRELCKLMGSSFGNDQAWQAALDIAGITSPRHVQIATEGALVGGLMENGFNPKLVIISDDAGQFNVFLHGLCWIHAERTISRMSGFNEAQRKALEDKRGQIWDYYNDLKKYKINPTVDEKNRLKDLFDVIFKGDTAFATLNMALKRLHANKEELLLVLERPEIPLHNNLSENDIREYVKKRKISGSTRSSPGRRCRDTFASLKKTCRKLGISFWDFLKDRSAGTCDAIPYLPELIRNRACES